MGNRDYKKFSPGNIFHIYNRGNNKEKIFLDDQDNKAFLFRLGICLGLEEKHLKENNLIAMPHSRIRITDVSKDDFRVYAFALMPNHFHLLIEQTKDIPISKLILKLCTSYSKYFNKKYRRVGHVFQDCFKAVLIKDTAQLMWTSSYIHTNPEKDGIVKHSKDYKWTSYNDYASERNLPIVSKGLLLEIFGGKQEFIEQNSYVKGSL